jgi:putative DNA primase/helicase
VVVRPQAHDDWTVVANQWACLVGRPGVMKSPAMLAVLKPLEELYARAEQASRGEGIDRATKQAIAQLLADEKKKRARQRLKEDPAADVSDLIRCDAEPEEPIIRRYVANDTSTESLGELLRQNPNGLLVFRDELVSLLDSLDEEGHISDRGFYLTGWNGDHPYTFDRIGRGLNLRVEAVCLSMLGSTQPGRISQYLSRAVRGGMGDDGLIQRFGLLVWPDLPGDWTHVDRWPDKAARTMAQAVFNRLDTLDWREIGAQRERGPDGDESGLPYLRFGIDAYERFVVWRTELERLLRRGDLAPALEAHFSKYRKLVPGLALISHLADGGTGAVTLASVERAIGWATYLETHARRAYGAVTAAQASTARAILARIRSGDLGREFSSRDVWRPQWSKLTDREVVQAGLDLLVDYDWLRCRKIETAGRPARVYTANPGIWSS